MHENTVNRYLEMLPYIEQFTEQQQKEWVEICDELLTILLDNNKDVLIRLKNR